jgi:hypothetical protein
LTTRARRRYCGGVKRLELARIRVCPRCGRGDAELRPVSGDADRVVTVRLDPVRVRQLAGHAPADGLRPLVDVVLDRLVADGARVAEVVLDVLDGRLRGLLSLVRSGETDVVECTAEEGVALAVRGGIRLYATDEALAAPKRDRPVRPDGGPDTLH